MRPPPTRLSWTEPCARRAWRSTRAAVRNASERPPASTEALIRMLDAVPGLPDGVVNMVHGPGDPTGQALVAHPGVDKVSFTGSTETGRAIMASAASTLKRLSLECGGKAPCLGF